MTVELPYKKFWTASGEMNRTASQYLNNSCRSLWPLLKTKTTRSYRCIINFSVCKNKLCPPQNKSFAVSYSPNSKNMASSGCDLTMEMWLWISNIIWRFLILGHLIPSLDTKTNNSKEFKPFFAFYVKQVPCFQWILFVEITLSRFSGRGMRNDRKGDFQIKISD